jgi:hypothetical protein
MVQVDWIFRPHHVIGGKGGRWLVEPVVAKPILRY